MNFIELLKVLLDFLSTLIWPIVLLIFIFNFKKPINSLIERIKSGEVAGAKFTFNETASGFISSKIDVLAKQQDPNQRALIADEIKDVAVILNSVHPVALAILINAAEGGGMIWSSTAYLDKKQYFDALEKAGLSKTKEETMSNGLLTAKIEISTRGYDLLRSIGMHITENNEIHQ